MAQKKPLSALSPAYRRRLENYYRKRNLPFDENSSRQAARGKKVGREYAERKQRRANPPGPTMTGELQPGQKGQVTRHAKFLADKSTTFTNQPLSGAEREAWIAQVHEWVKMNGWAKFVALRAFQTKLEADYRAELANDSYNINPGMLDNFAVEYEVDDVRWFYYH